jgi:hypothetical protein
MICPKCNGSGRVWNSPDYTTSMGRICDQCWGSGQVIPAVFYGEYFPPTEPPKNKKRLRVPKYYKRMGASR